MAAERNIAEGSDWAMGLRCTNIKLHSPKICQKMCEHDQATISKSKYFHRGGPCTYKICTVHGKEYVRNSAKDKQKNQQ